MNKIPLYTVTMQDEDSVSSFSQLTEEKAYQDAIDELVIGGAWEEVMDEESVPDDPLTALQLLDERMEGRYSFSFELSSQELELPTTPEQKFMEEFHADLVANKNEIGEFLHSGKGPSQGLSTLDMLALADKRLAYISVLLAWEDLHKKHFPTKEEEKSSE